MEANEIVDQAGYLVQIIFAWDYSVGFRWWYIKWSIWRSMKCQWVKYLARNYFHNWQRFPTYTLRGPFLSLSVIEFPLLLVLLLFSFVLFFIGKVCSSHHKQSRAVTATFGGNRLFRLSKCLLSPFLFALWCTRTHTHTQGRTCTASAAYCHVYCGENERKTFESPLPGDGYDGNGVRGVVCVCNNNNGATNYNYARSKSSVCR